MIHNADSKLASQNSISNKQSGPQASKKNAEYLVESFSSLEIWACSRSAHHIPKLPGCLGENGVAVPGGASRGCPNFSSVSLEYRTAFL
ncbi:hypothetical protein AVEN_231521-1 [Araneus ventricosus]|uniref:Uncharacterized protein n=1 Tax=Araneus ventricosus TaxID=182803 RepID=A0A4Y2ICH0_ARAVE|nr:hypothetical protein AVEN_231521-1 [Araneus ventricosus]